jgi:murein DD-endopeptidase MepM/ murein hydrolase activator NlpD
MTGRVSTHAASRAFRAWLMAGVAGACMPMAHAIGIAPDHDIKPGTATRAVARPSPPLLISQATRDATQRDASIEAAAIDARLVERRLLTPVVGVSPQQLRNTFDEKRGGKTHEALDIMAPRGTPVVATDDGRVVKLFRSVPGGITIYQADRDNEVIYYYAHLDAYAEGLREGQLLKRGDVIGYVGSTGNASAAAPHLHFAVLRMPPGKEWWKGTPVDPLPLLQRPKP